MGALYYLKVKQLLESTPDDEVTRQSYIRIVQEIQRSFLEGVRENIRMKAFSSFSHNVKMIFSDSYSRSHRFGELYESILYRDAAGGMSDAAIRMRDLLIKPQGREAFKPRTCNWRRQAKVPVLLLNATSLNTGHNWHFTAGFMGEPPGMLTSAVAEGEHLEVDKNNRYRRVRYDQAPEELKHYRLGFAVAASACVPGLFAPLAINGLYPGKIVRLVDGGVHDNQGIAGLLDERCTFILCSDASGQMGDKQRPSDDVVSVLSRSSSITMDRVREEQYQKLRARLNGGVLRGLFFIHLKKDFPVGEENWIGCADESRGINQQGDLPYGIDLSIQNAIAGIRTDLDAFSDVEAYSLMASGYLMAKQEADAIQKRIRDANHEAKWSGFQVDAPTLGEDGDSDERKWKFLKLQGLLTSAADRPAIQAELKKQLKIAHAKAFKAWMLDPGLKWAGIGMLAIFVFLGGLCIQANWRTTLSITIGGLATALGVIVLSVLIRFLLGKLHAWMEKKGGKRSGIMDTIYIILSRVARWISFEKAIRNVAKDAGIALVGFLLATLYLRIFNPIFLRLGSLERLLKSKK